MSNRSLAIAETAVAAVSEALETINVLATHTNQLADVLQDREEALVRVVADIDARIAAVKTAFDDTLRDAHIARDEALATLEAERRDAELASSGITAALMKIKE